MMIQQNEILNRVVITLVIIIFLFAPTNAQEQKVNIRQFGISSGLSSQYVCSVYQDSKGFLWFATDKGLDRYDGYTFTSYTYPINPKKMGVQLPGTISEDKDGHLWVLSLNGGVADFDPENLTFKNYLPDSSKSPTDFANSVYGVYVDKNDIIWLGTGHGLNGLG